jgi:hypothetical protein
MQGSGFKLASIDELQLKLKEFIITEQIVATVDLNNTLYNFYVKNVWSQLLKSLLTIKALGSMPNLIRHVSTGCSELVSRPRTGF